MAAKFRLPKELTADAVGGREEGPEGGAARGEMRGSPARLAGRLRRKKEARVAWSVPLIVVDSSPMSGAGMRSGGDARASTLVSFRTEGIEH